MKNKDLSQFSTKATALLSKKERTLPELAKALRLPITETGDLLIELGKVHPGIQRVGTKIFIDDPRIRGLDPLTFSFPMGTSGKIGIVSCSHLGSKYELLTYLYEMYDRFSSEKVDCILHCGDLTDGDGKVYRGQRYEMFLQGFSEQRDYTVDLYPRIEGVTTYVIAGNHDDSFAKSAGIDICREICSVRDDITYLGRYGANILLNDEKIKIHMHHGGGSGTKMISWRLQNYIDGIEPGDKPQIYLLGHFHRAFGPLFYRNVLGFEVGCFQSKTPYAIRLGLPWRPSPGGWIIEYEIRDTWGLDAIRSTFVPFYVPIKDDWKNFPH